MKKIPDPSGRLGGPVRGAGGGDLRQRDRLPTATAATACFTRPLASGRTRSC